LRHYEFLFILKPTLDNEEMRARIESMNEIITKNDGIVAKCDELGIKSLAYEIAKNKRGYYVVTYFQAPAVAIKEIERIARINEDLIRFLTTKYNSRKEIAQESDDEIECLALHQEVPGNVPSNTIVLEKITPKSLGALIALYEHKVFVQGVIWQINSFDQWGVQLGKKIANKLVPILQGEKDGKDLDGSTLGLIKKWKKI